MTKNDKLENAAVAKCKKRRFKSKSPGHLASYDKLDDYFFYLCSTWNGLRG